MYNKAWIRFRGTGGPVAAHADLVVYLMVARGELLRVLVARF